MDDMTPQSITADDEGAVLALNNAHAVELSWLEIDRLTRLVGWAFHARRIGRLEAFLIAFDETSGYDGGHFQWFRARYPRFVYVDRVVVDPAARGRGHARRLYLDLFDHARRGGHDIVTCEVNAEPPNPASDAFHAAMGFAPVGSASHDGKTVRYFVHRLG
ncbi:MAG TPA: GNAT family N-acetyltransferase [Vineibacter sp.]|nr:GNAT family N-acetyltransferase [Vineibacter sp.]